MKELNVVTPTTNPDSMDPQKLQPIAIYLSSLKLE